MLRPGRAGQESARPIRSILFIRPGGIGDAVLLLPAINAVRAQFQDAEVDLLCEKRNAGVFDLAKGIRRTYLYDKGSGLLKCLRNDYDAVIDTEQWHRFSAIAAYCTGARVRIGFNTNERGGLFTHKIAYSHDDYEVRSFMRLIEPLVKTINPNGPVTGAETDIMPALPFIDLSNEGPIPLLPGDFSNEDRLVAIFPGASVKERRWGGEKFGKTAKALIDKGCRLVILGSVADRAEAGRINAYAKDCMDLTGKTSLRDAARILSGCSALITADSGLMHIAFAVGTPTVSLFGSGIEKKWGPRGEGHIILNRRLPCSPCTKFGYTPPCPKNAECISGISVREVVEAVEKILNNPKLKDVTG